MGYVIKAFALVCWTILVPFLIGMLPCSLLPQKRRTPGMILLSGYFVSYAVFELVGLPVLLLTKTGNFPLLVLLYTILAAAMAMAGYVLTGGVSGVNWTAFLGGPSGGLEADTDVVDLKTLREETKSSPLIPAVLWAAFLCLLLYEFYMAYTHLFFDGDDAYYVVQSVISWETNTMYHYLPYTGGSTSLDLRHAMAMFPMWVAYLARISTMHPTAVAHSFLPMLMIALSDLLLFQTASSLFEGGEFPDDALVAGKICIREFYRACCLSALFTNIPGGKGTGCPVAPILLVHASLRQSGGRAVLVHGNCSGGNADRSVRTFHRGGGQKMAYSAEVGSVLYSDCGVCGYLFPFEISFAVLQ